MFLFPQLKMTVAVASGFSVLWEFLFLHDMIPYKHNETIPFISKVGYPKVDSKIDDVYSVFEEF